MTVIEVVQILQEIKEEQIDLLSLRQFHALEVARAVLISLEPSHRDIINAILAMPEIQEV